MAMNFLQRLRHARDQHNRGINQHGLKMLHASNLEMARKTLAVNGEFFYGSNFLRLQQVADWQHVDRRLVQFAFTFLEMARSKGIPLFVRVAFRTARDHQVLYEPNHKKIRSLHCTGSAVEIVHAIRGDDMSVAEWQLLHLVAGEALTQKGLEEQIVNALPKTEWGVWHLAEPWQTLPPQDDPPERATARGLKRLL